MRPDIAAIDNRVVDYYAEWGDCPSCELSGDLRPLIDYVLQLEVAMRNAISHMSLGQGMIALKILEEATT